MVNLGGDIAVAGPPPDGGWRVTICDDHADPTSGPDADRLDLIRRPCDVEHAPFAGGRLAGGRFITSSIPAPAAARRSRGGPSAWRRAHASTRTPRAPHRSCEAPSRHLGSPASGFRVGWSPPTATSSRSADGRRSPADEHPRRRSDPLLVPDPKRRGGRDAPPDDERRARHRRLQPLERPGMAALPHRHPSPQRLDAGSCDGRAARDHDRRGRLRPDRVPGRDSSRSSPPTVRSGSAWARCPSTCSWP